MLTLRLHAVLTAAIDVGRQQDTGVWNGSVCVNRLVLFVLASGSNTGPHKQTQVLVEHLHTSECGSCFQDTSARRRSQSAVTIFTLGRKACGYLPSSPLSCCFYRLWGVLCSETGLLFYILEASKLKCSFFIWKSLVLFSLIGSNDVVFVSSCLVWKLCLRLLSAAEASWEQRKCICALNNEWTPYCGWKSEDVALDERSVRAFAA